MSTTAGWIALAAVAGFLLLIGAAEIPRRHVWWYTAPAVTILLGLTALLRGWGWTPLGGGT